jgi:hypothetical protein
MLSARVIESLGLVRIRSDGMQRRFSLARRCWILSPKRLFRPFAPRVVYLCLAASILPGLLICPSAEMLRYAVFSSINRQHLLRNILCLVNAAFTMSRHVLPSNALRSSAPSLASTTLVQPQPIAQSQNPANHII